MYIWAALSLGLISNFHCLGMCGPIALAIPVKSNTWNSRLISILIYNSGRILTYGVIGAIFGLLGQGVFLMGYQQQISISIGIFIVIFALLYLLNKKIDFTSKIFSSKILILQQGMKKYLMQKGYSNNFILGLLNGILPCGLVYIALFGALATGNLLSGILYMVFFGIGTLPVMVLLPWIKEYLTFNFRSKLQKSIPVFLLIFGGLLIARGANLGIPFLSPKVDKTEQTNGNDKAPVMKVHKCH